MTAPPRPGVIVICGPTGIGKTDAAIHLSEAFNGRILSADSMQLYRHMDIGTAKPTPEELTRAPHDLIDVADPDEEFDAGKFATLGRAAIARNHAEGRLTIVAGGTGLYIKTLLHGLFRSRPADPLVLRELEARAAAEGAAALHLHLADMDPAAAKKIHPNDTFRVVRALEVLQSTGKRISERQEDHGFTDTPDYAVFKLGLTMDRERLYERINHRVDLMLEAGLLAEVKALIAAGFGPELKSMQSIGYRHMVAYIQGQTDWEETVRLLKRDTRRYAKRQFTWFHADPAVRWVAPDAVLSLVPEIKKALKEQGGLG